MRMLSAVAVMVLLTAPAYAQSPNINLIPELASKTPEEKEAEAVRDKAYKELAEEDPRRQGVFRSVGHGAKQRRAEGGRSAGQAEDQDRQQRAAQPVASAAARRILGTQDSLAAASYIQPVVGVLA